MLLTPLPGGRDNLLNNLEFIRRDLSNARTSNTKVIDKHKSYLDAIAGGARMLRGQVRPSDIDELLHTRRYWALVEMTLSVNPPSNVISDLLDLEIDDRLLELDDTIATTRDAINRWANTAGHLVLPDTNFYLRHESVLENIDFPTVLGTGDTITILFPLVVIKELDNAKYRRDDARSKATVALAVLEAHVKDGLSGKWKHGPAGNVPGRGDIWFDVLLDPPGHVALDNADAEIIDRAVAVQTLSGRAVTLLTHDTSQAFRARGFGIKDVRRLEVKDKSKN